MKRFGGTDSLRSVHARHRLGALTLSWTAIVVGLPLAATVAGLLVPGPVL